MIRIAITPAAFEAIAATLPLGGALSMPATKLRGQPPPLATARSSAGLRSSASFTMTRPSSGSSALSCSEQNDEWAVQRARYMTLETMAALSDNSVVGLPAMVI